MKSKRIEQDVVVIGSGFGGSTAALRLTEKGYGVTVLEGGRWKAELSPHYDQARRMLGVVDNPTMTPSDEMMRLVAEDMGVGHTFRPTPVGVYFGTPGETASDPYFGGAGPARTGCIECGQCMTGCRHGAKNTLLQNYLYLAERGGAKVEDRSTVTAVRPLPDGRFAVDVRRTGGLFARWRQRRTLIARDVVVAAGTLGTQNLLHRMKHRGHLPNLSPCLGELTRTNSEALLGARTFRKDVDFTRGVAITSSFYPDAHTHVEPVRYGRGSNMMGLLTTALTDGDRSRWRSWGREVLRHPVAFCRSLVLRRWSEQSIIALVMQNVDNALTCYLRRGLFGRRLTSRQGPGAPNPGWIPIGHTVVRKLAARIRGIPLGGWSEVFNIPMTAHILGGAVIGDSAQSGVVDPYQRVYDYPNMHIMDGSALSANLGVNPSLSITAQAERACALWPNRGDADQRPAQDAPYQRLAPVVPANPIVPAGAPGALRYTMSS